MQFYHNDHDMNGICSVTSIANLWQVTNEERQVTNEERRVVTTNLWLGVLYNNAVRSDICGGLAFNSYMENTSVIDLTPSFH